MHTFMLRHKWALGDTVLMTALVRDIHRAYPGMYRVMVDTHWSPVWWNNPNIVPLDANSRPAPQKVELNYKAGIMAAGRGEKVHFLSWYHRDFEHKTSVKVPVTEPRGQIFLTEEEKQPFITGRYWIVNAGGKKDMTTKIWYTDRYQQVVDVLHGIGLRFVQVGATHTDHIHPPLRSVLSAVGYTENVRDLFSLIYHCDGIIGPVTACMHLAAVFNKPCVVLAGGVEEPWWESYSKAYPGAFGPHCSPVAVEHKYLHTLGLLPCCQSKGCWRPRTVPLDQRDQPPAGARRICLEPRRNESQQPTPLCLDMITIDHVIEAVMSYYESGMLPPIGKPSGKYTVGMDPGSATGDRTVKQLVLLTPEAAPEVMAPPIFLRPPSLPPRQQHSGQVKFATLPVLPQGQDSALWDHPIIGGKLTVCVCCYGPHFDLAQRCIDSILKTVPAQRLDLRVACNDCCPETLEYLTNRPLTKLYVHHENHLKYPAMRQMFWDRHQPIQTSYIVWFDDDSYVIDPRWTEKLVRTIIDNHPQGCRLFGWKFLHDLKAYHRNGHRPDQWFRQADWYRGVDFLSGNGQKTAPNGSLIAFAAGGFWALCTETMRQANIPDVRLQLSGGDIVLGAQCHQLGAKIKDCNQNKCWIFSSGAPPRGLSPRTPGEKVLPWSGKA